jgi:hypothetical protein
MTVNSGDAVSSKLGGARLPTKVTWLTDSSVSADSAGVQSPT